MSETTYKGIIVVMTLIMLGLFLVIAASGAEAARYKIERDHLQCVLEAPDTAALIVCDGQKVVRLQKLEKSWL